MYTPSPALSAEPPAAPRDSRSGQAQACPRPGRGASGTRRVPRTSRRQINESELAFDSQVTDDELKGGHGHLIRSEELTGYAALEAARATYRVIYESTSGVDGQRNEPIGVSGIIAFPTDDPPDGGLADNQLGARDRRQR